jgi:hypothetical protein
VDVVVEVVVVSRSRGLISLIERVVDVGVEVEVMVDARTANT